MRALATLLAIAACLTTATPARAQDAPPADTAPATDEARALEARTLFEQGVRASRDERWAEALDLFQRSRALVPRASTLFNVAIALDRLGRVRASIAAIDEYLEISDATADAADRSAAMRLRVEAEARLARLVVRVDPEDARVEIDGSPIEPDSDAPGRRATVLDPGDHVVLASAPGHVDERTALSVRPGAELERVIVLAPIAAPIDAAVTTLPEPGEPSDRGEPARSGGLLEDPVFWAILGAGVALAAGVAIGVGAHVASAPQPYGGSLGVSFEGP